MFKKVSNLFKEIQLEMTRVSWPTRAELRGSTVVVIMVTLACTVFIFIVDNILKYLFDLLYGF